VPEHKQKVIQFHSFREFCTAVGGKVDGNLCRIVLTDFERGDALIPNTGDVATCVVKTVEYTEEPQNIRVKRAISISDLMPYKHHVDSAEVECTYGEYTISIHVHGATSKGKHYDVTVHGPTGLHVGRYIHRWQRRAVKRLLLGWD